jgi:hypothetical protein
VELPNLKTTSKLPQNYLKTLQKTSKPHQMYLSGTSKCTSQVPLGYLRVVRSRDLLDLFGSFLIFLDLLRDILMRKKIIPPQYMVPAGTLEILGSFLEVF